MTELTKADNDVLRLIFKSCSYDSCKGRVGGECADCGEERNCFRVRKKLGISDVFG